MFQTIIRQTQRFALLTLLAAMAALVATAQQATPKGGQVNAGIDFSKPLDAGQIDTLARVVLNRKGLILDPRISLQDQRAIERRIVEVFKEAGKIAPRDAQGQFLGVLRAQSPNQQNITKIPAAGSVTPPAPKPTPPTFFDNVGFRSPLTDAQRKTVAERIVKEGGGIVTDKNINNADRAAIGALVKQLSTQK